MVDFAKNLPIRGNVQSGMDAISDMPRASVYRTTTQAIPTVATLAVSAIVWDTAEFNEDALWSAGNPSLFFCRTAGLYACTGWVTWAPSAAGGYRQMYFQRTTQAGVVTQFGDTIYLAGTVSAIGEETTKLIPMDAGDALQLYVGHNTGANLNIGASTALDRENGMQACLIST